MTNDNTKQFEDQQAEQGTEQEAREIEAELREEAELEDEDTAFDPAMFAQVEEVMKKLERVDELERELNDTRGKYARLLADFENYRRRTNQDVLDAQGTGVAKAVEALLPVFDDLSRAVEHAEKDPGSIVGGVSSVRDGMLRTFERLGLTQTGAEGETFDPAWHEALTVVPGDRDGEILQVYQVGFRLGERLVRPARVVVVKESN
ncbi:nucleotide exchange factor GrpE [Deinococcus peraridilitoris]|uniref:Protein GrpE n=1 Tax=Deinococcus peraridilitoris (strain DSM 19664 / LMG 22246 / CIP 109416 / KR-200) TaxID=937777 RepID=L0A6N6_DEIPD|nr:nucleotide exchange factor GrpE [Deinococcus peraridilitoris]AFZ68680.1 molecular chaperone GrpE (heat shock protein) [Deinococcus peraridilitoris DSM 19664]